MARKLKISIPSHPSLFDTPEGREAIHPAIEDFVIKSRAKALDKAASSPSETPFIEAISERTSAENLIFLSFGSGSSGNCAYIGTRREGVIIDAGIDPDKVRDALRVNGLSFDCVKGVLLTHDHSDHVRYVYKMVRLRKNIAVYCTPKTLNGMLRRHNISRRIKDYHSPIYKEFPFQLAGMTVTAFDVSHDGTDNVGFYIEGGTHRFAVATDLGHITDRVDHYMRLARIVVIEANYDAEMLRTGPYSAYLKSRIAADNGHLDNLDTARFVGSLALNGNLEYVFLCHLSQENNLPQKALDAVSAELVRVGMGEPGDCSNSLESLGRRIKLMALPRFECSPLMVFRPKQA